MKICFYGVGGVGGYFGSIITKELGCKHDIYFIARGTHKEKIIEHGLTLKKSGGNEIISVHPKTCIEKVKEVMVEIETIAKKRKIPLESGIIDTSFQKAKQFPFETKTSFYRDIEKKGRINEGDLFGGTLKRYGESLRVSTSNIEFVYNKLLERLG